MRVYVVFIKIEAVKEVTKSFLYKPFSISGDTLILLQSQMKLSD